MGATSFNFENELNDIFLLLSCLFFAKDETYHSPINDTYFKYVCTVDGTKVNELFTIEINALGILFQKTNKQEITVKHGISNHGYKSQGLIKDIIKALNNKKLV